MEITIDTKRDSKDDIRRAVEFLKGFLEESSYSSGGGLGSSGESSSEPAPQPGLFGMFGSDDQSSDGSSSQESSSRDGSSTDGPPDDSGDGSPERIEIVPY